MPVDFADLDAAGTAFQSQSRLTFCAPPWWGGCGSKNIKNRNPEIQPTSPLAMERCTRGAKAVAEVFLERKAIIFSPLRRERSRRNTPALTRTTRSGARSFGVALGIISRPKKCLFDPGLNLMESIHEINKVVTISAECARGRTLRFTFSKTALFALVVC